ncbi:MAG: family 16 glycoside hydrolase [Anaerolineae bacterium]
MVRKRRIVFPSLGSQARLSGQGLVEYAIILGLLSALVLGALAMTGHSVGDVFSQVNRTIGGEPVEVEPTPTPPGETPVPTPTPTLDQPPTPGPTPTPTPGGGFWDDFDQPCDPPPAPCPPGWQRTMGQYWYLDNGWLCAGRTDGGNSGEHRAFTGQSDWTDYTVTVRAILHNTGAPSTTQGFGIFFRVTLDAQGNPTGYLFQYDPGQRGIVPPWPWEGTKAQPDYAPPEPPEPGLYRGAFTYRKVVNGAVRPPFAQAIAPWDYKWFEVEREIRIVVRGNTFTTYIDGVQVLQATDSEFSAGQIGLRLWGRSNACFDRVGVTVP